MIIDANLAIKENLQNIFLLEFDLNNYNKKHKFCPSCFNNCVEWTLNVSFTQDKINYSHVSK